MNEPTQCHDHRCDVPLSNGYTLCPRHIGDLSRLLGRVREVWGNLRVTIRRQDTTTPAVGGGGASTESKPCLNLDAHDKSETLAFILNGWAAMLIPNRRPTPPPAAADFLTQYVDAIAHEEWAGELIAELSESIHDCTVATDRQTERISLGVCGYKVDLDDCPGLVTATLGANRAVCRLCGVVWDVRERQQWMISEAWGAEGSLRLIVSALRAANQITANYETVKKWGQRGKLYGRCDIATRSHVYTAAGVLRSCTESNTPARVLIPA